MSRSRLLFQPDYITERNKVRKLGASPDVLVGSVHILTAQGEVVIASAVGQQLGPAASGAGVVIWVVGTQKPGRTLEDRFRRIQEKAITWRTSAHCRVSGHTPALNTLLMVNAEAAADRITIFLIKENLGF